jgi:hypothetical protein
MELNRPTQPSVTEMLRAARNEQKELFDWLKKDRKQDTLKKEDAEKLYGLFIMHGFSTFGSLYNIPWRAVENMGLSQDLMAWLSAWLPKSYNEETPAESFTPLLGHWEDSMGGRRCTIKQDYSEESKTCIVEEQDSNRKDGKIGVDYEDPANVLLEAPWGKNGVIRKWWGRIENNGTRIRWEGRRGESFWHKIAE